MTTLDFNINFKDLAGNDTSTNIGKELGARLVQSTEKDRHRVMKLMKWGQDLYSEGKITIDEADTKYLAELILANETLTVLGKAQILEIIDKAK